MELKWKIKRRTDFAETGRIERGGSFDTPGTRTQARTAYLRKADRPAANVWCSTYATAGRTTATTACRGTTGSAGGTVAGRTGDGGGDERPASAASVSYSMAKNLRGDSGGLRTTTAAAADSVMTRRPAHDVPDAPVGRSGRAATVLGARRDGPRGRARINACRVKGTLATCAVRTFERACGGRPPKGPAAAGGVGPSGHGRVRRRDPSDGRDAPRTRGDGGPGSAHARRSARPAATPFPPFRSGVVLGRRIRTYFDESTPRTRVRVDVDVEFGFFFPADKATTSDEFFKRPAKKRYDLGAWIVKFRKLRFSSPPVRSPLDHVQLFAWYLS